MVFISFAIFSIHKNCFHFVICILNNNNDNNNHNNHNHNHNDDDDNDNDEDNGNDGDDNENENKAIAQKFYEQFYIFNSHVLY